MGDKRILITGGCGFIGSEVVKNLIKRGYEVTVLDNLSKPESSVKEGYKFVKVDLTDKNATNEAFRDHKIVINLAAKIGGIGYFHKYPATILSENNKIYSNTFEAAAKHNYERMVYISSSMVFESTNKFPSKEEHITEVPMPISAYGFSKLSGERYCTAFYEEYGLPYSICRPFNAYGINEFPAEEIGYAHVIPDLVKKILNGQYPLEILGDGQQSRCYTHISDIADGIVTVAESKKAENQDFNVSTAEETKVTELAKKLWKICGQNSQNKELKFKHVPGFKYDVKRRVPDVAKMKKLLGWEAKVKLDDGLSEVVTWLRERM